jgi:hypothetical protein
MNTLESVARVKELERAIADTTDSISWRITSPLRWLQRAVSSNGQREQPPELTPRSLSHGPGTDESS